MAIGNFKCGDLKTNILLLCKSIKTLKKRIHIQYPHNCTDPQNKGNALFMPHDEQKKILNAKNNGKLAALFPFSSRKSY